MLPRLGFTCSGDVLCSSFAGTVTSSKVQPVRRLGGYGFSCDCIYNASIHGKLSSSQLRSRKNNAVIMVKKAQSVTRKVTKNRTRTLNELRKLKNRVKPGLDFEQQIGIYIREFARTGCKSHAARAAGFSDSYATEVFKSMMSDPAIKKRIQDSCRSRIKRLDLDIDRLVQELVILVHSRFTDVAEIEDGQLIIANTTQLSDLDIAAISKVSENKTERTSKNPETGEIETTITTRINVELYDRIAAARELIRILGLDKSEDALITGFGQYGYDIVRDANGKYVMIDRRSQAVEEAETAAETS